MAPHPSPQLAIDIINSVKSSELALISSQTYDSTVSNLNPKLRAAIFSGVLVTFISAFRAYRRVKAKNAEAAQIPLALRPNQAQNIRSSEVSKERKFLTEEEIKLYSVVEFTEKMARSSKKDDGKSTSISQNPIDNESSTKESENEADKDSKDKQKIIKSHSNISSNSLSQEKGKIFDPTPTNKIQNESIRNNSKINETNGSECLICFEAINIGDKIREIPCLHRFHKECLDNWLTTRSGSCPNCRYDLRQLKDSSLENGSEIDISIRNPNLVSNTGVNIIPASQYQNNVIFEINNTGNVNKKSLARQVLEEMFKETFSSRRSRRGIGTSSRFISNANNTRNQR
ncbi:Receptor homology region, transmembrane domain- and RING domain-containing protein 3 [Smittium culicis]|uniref:RING-type E3 ubiquitin transferase n=1 Tax=Smittium culicis TaxID=133412 RepID=A0A1R1YAA7_9FUNG|nr:Receptor homology region, transmembrane domain- and RING domain-containing protein 3 [Smittium culicis]